MHDEASIFTCTWRVCIKGKLLRYTVPRTYTGSRTIPGKHPDVTRDLHTLNITSNRVGSYK